MTEVAAPPKETKAQRAERLKRAKNPWEAFDEVRTFAREGRSSVVPEWAGMYFKWWGIYTQGDGVGATGGKGGEGLVSDYFMMRIGIPNGIIRRPTADHRRHHAEVCAQSGRHHRPAEYPIALANDRVPARSSGCSGRDRPLAERRLRRRGAQRNGLPPCRVDHDELIDASPIALENCELLTANSDFYNLPRKFKISVTGCPTWCSYPEINDIALTPVKRDGQVGFTVRVGGGLSTSRILPSGSMRSFFLNRRWP